MIIQRSFLLAGAALLLARTAGAQGLVVTVTGNAQSLTVDANWQADAPLPANDPVQVEVRCDSHTDCRQVQLFALANGTAASPWTPDANASPAVARFTLARAAVGGTTGPAVIVRTGGRDFARPDTHVATNDAASLSSTSSQWTGNPFVACDPGVATRKSGPGHAVFLVTPTGSVVARSAPSIDEDDSVTVYVQGTPDVVSKVFVRRSSPFREFDALSIVGMDAKTGGLIPHAANAGEADCLMTSATVENFKGGEAGEVEILLMAPDKQDSARVQPESAGKFQFPVHRLYRGAFSFGVMRTELAAPSYSVAEGDSILRRSGAGPRFLYTLAYTPYLWGPRDVEAWSVRRLPMYINPTVGVGVSETVKNVLGGLTLELPTGIFLTAGLHAGKVSRPVEGLRAGAAVPAALRTSVSEERWKVGRFYSLTIDLRAAVKFLGALAGKS